MIDNDEVIRHTEEDEDFVDPDKYQENIEDEYLHNTKKTLSKKR